MEVDCEQHEMEVYESEKNDSNSFGSSHAAVFGSNDQTLPAQGVIERPKQSETTDFAVSTQPVGDTNLTVSDETENTEVSTSSNILIAYFTVTETDGVDMVANASRVSTDNGVVGNTEFIAMEIQKNLGVICLPLKLYRNIREAMILCWILRTMRRTMMQDQSFLLTLKAWMVTITFSLVFRTGMQIYQCRCIHSLKNMTSPAK